MACATNSCSRVREYSNDDNNNNHNNNNSSSGGRHCWWGNERRLSTTTAVAAAAEAKKQIAVGAVAHKQMTLLVRFALDLVLKVDYVWEQQQHHHQPHTR